jgi:heme/copper-type cytochrome/quinol oxidase subunit 3
LLSLQNAPNYRPGEEQSLPFRTQLMFIVSTGVIAASSVVLVYYRRGWARQRHSPLLVLVVLALGLAFLCTQVAGFWGMHAFLSAGGRLGHPKQMLYLITGVHALHLLLGLGLMAMLAKKLFLGPDHQDRRQTIALVEPYWHLLTVVWVVFYALL